MAALAGTITYRTVVNLTAASAGDATTIAAKFNGKTIAAVDVVGTAVASTSTADVTIYWTPTTQVRAGNDMVLDAVLNIIAPDTSLTSPVTAVYVRTEGNIA